MKTVSDMSLYIKPTDLCGWMDNKCKVIAELQCIQCHSAIFFFNECFILCSVGVVILEGNTKGATRSTDCIEKTQRLLLLDYNE